MTASPLLASQEALGKVFNLRMSRTSDATRSESGSLSATQRALATTTVERTRRRHDDALLQAKTDWSADARPAIGGRAIVQISIRGIFRRDIAQPA